MKARTKNDRIAIMMPVRDIFFSSIVHPFHNLRTAQVALRNYARRCPNARVCRWSPPPASRWWDAIGARYYPGIVSTVRLRSNKHATVRCWGRPAEE
jgi:hypothetical protein